MKKSLIGSGLAAALLLAGCATPPPANTAAPSAPAGGASTAAAPASDFTACMVSDAGGFDDKSFNQTSHKGLTDAVAQLGVKQNEAQSKTTSDFATNIDQMVSAGCNIVVTVGFMLGDATEAAAKANPDVDLAIVDYAYDAPAENLKGLVFNTGEPAFMAGYVAASLSQTGKVATFGGAKIPSVTAFMEGYAQGVKYHNEKKGTNVEVLGWSSETQDGQFIPGASPFEDLAGGKRVADTLVSQGADVILPVAGPAGEGGLQAAQASGGKVVGMWVDTDGYVSLPSYSSIIATSVGKAMDVAVFEAIKASKEGTFNNEVYVGTLENEGAYLAPFHDFDSKVSAETKAELEQIKADIISGAIKIEA